MAASLLRLSRPRRALLPLSALRLQLSTQPLPQPREPSSSPTRGLPAFLSFLAAAAAAAGGTTATVAFCDSDGRDHRLAHAHPTETTRSVAAPVTFRIGDEPS
jgi:D-lactate dehydrogenase (cytochrome)